MAPGHLPIPVHLALPDPVGPPPAPDFKPPATFADPQLDWAAYGLEPRWLGQESSDCAVALDPSIDYRHGAPEFERLLEAAHQRGEVVLVVATLGDINAEPKTNIFGHDASVVLGWGIDARITGDRLPSGAKVHLAEGIDGPEKDLANRLTSRPPSLPWWTIALRGQPIGGPPSVWPLPGELIPILVDALGEPVVAVWVSEGLRLYVVPAGTDPHVLLGWLVDQALPHYVPGAVRRTRTQTLVDPVLQTEAERSAHRQLQELEANYHRERARLEALVHEVTGKAHEVRDPLLYGSGSDLVNAVAVVLRDAGLTVADLDEELGGTKSADLVVTYDERRLLIEVKGVTGRPKEPLVDQLRNHLRTWPSLRPHEPITRGVLVVNYERKKEPHERLARPYDRPEFLKTLDVTVLSSFDLWRWWAAGDHDAIITAVLQDTKPESVAGTGKRARRRLFRGK